MAFLNSKRGCPKWLVSAITIFAVFCLWQSRTSAGPSINIELKQITQTSFKTPARNPSLVSLSDDTYLWWRYPLAESDAGSMKGIPMGNAVLTQNTFVPSQQITYGVHGYPETLHLYAVGKNTMAACLMSGSYFRESWDATTFLVERNHEASTSSPQFQVSARMWSNLPGSIEGMSNPEKPWTPQSEFDLGKDAYRQPTLLVEKAGQSWFMVGVEGMNRDAGKMWFTKSSDKGKTWQKRQILGAGNLPEIVRSSSDLLILYTDTGPSGYLTQWPDDAPKPIEPDVSEWPATGRLMMLRSSDEGKTWSKPQLVMDAPRAIQCRAYAKADGHIWLTYVESDPNVPNVHRTSLWLTSSQDNGKTWMAPVRLTDGKYLDREPDIIEHDGKVMVAFSRAGRGINTNIWLAEVSVAP